MIIKKLVCSCNEPMSLTKFSNGMFALGHLSLQCKTLVFYGHNGSELLDLVLESSDLPANMPTRNESPAPVEFPLVADENADPI